MALNAARKQAVTQALFELVTCPNLDDGLPTPTLCPSCFSRVLGLVQVLHSENVRTQQGMDTGMKSVADFTFNHSRPCGELMSDVS